MPDHEKDAREAAYRNCPMPVTRLVVEYIWDAALAYASEQGTSEEAVERVARALFDTQSHRGERARFWEEVAPFLQDEWRRMARAALAAAAGEPHTPEEPT